MKDKLRTTLLPLIAAFIWGTAFVAQKVNTMGALTFNAARSIVAFPFLLILILIFTKGDYKHILSENTKEDTKTLWIGGIIMGLSMAAATFFQQKGMDLGTEGGKAGFITALYIVLVPVFGLFLKKKVQWNVWVSILLAVLGLYFICVKEGFSVRLSDMLVVPAAALFAVQILAIDHYSLKANAIKLSCIQFLVSFIVSLILALIFEKISFEMIKENLLPVLYLGIFSSGIAYTLQVISQRGANAAVVSLLMSMESVFSVLASAVVLHEVLRPIEYIGCAVMFVAVILTQVPVKPLRRKS